MKKTLKTSLMIAVLATTGWLHAESTAPVLVQGDKPAYPKEARTQGIEGTVVIEALVDENGNVFAADVVESVHPKLDAVTVAAVENWKFTAAKADGEPVMQVVRIPVEYNLVDPVEASLPAQAVAAK